MLFSHDNIFELNMYGIWFAKYIWIASFWIPLTLSSSAKTSLRFYIFILISWSIHSFIQPERFNYRPWRDTRKPLAISAPMVHYSCFSYIWKRIKLFVFFFFRIIESTTVNISLISRPVMYFSRLPSIDLRSNEGVFSHFVNSLYLASFWPSTIRINVHQY